MIRLTALNGRELVVNAMLVERIEAVPDTVITLTTGSTCAVRESVDEVIERAVDYLRSLRDAETGATPATIAQYARNIR
ncbi:MAG: flagellar FlbD family protein [candidate division WS1 bacterium]|jgi:flagellar protein FlbD|nr:flagellar FlbD family protein [candidate division WS1 bacterium]